MRPRILVWGAFGFIGRHVTRFLLHKAADVRVLTRQRSLYDEPDWLDCVQHFELDSASSQRNVFRAALKEVDIVLDFAGSSGAVASNQDPVQNLDGNCRAHLEFLEACSAAERPPHVVFTSSRLVYGETGTEPVDESHPVDPRSIYACHKLCIENYLNVYARLGKITHSTCRISNVYGEDDCHRGQGYRVINGFIKRACSGAALTLFGDGRQLRDFVYIDDLVDALWACATMPAAVNQLFNIGSGHVNTMLDAAEMIQRLTGAPPIKFAPWPDEYRNVESGDFVIDLSKAQSLLGFAPRYDLPSGIARTVEAYRKLQPGTADSASPAYALSKTAKAGDSAV